MTILRLVKQSCLIVHPIILIDYITPRSVSDPVCNRIGHPWTSSLHPRAGGWISLKVVFVQFCYLVESSNAINLTDSQPGWSATQKRKYWCVETGELCVKYVCPSESILIIRDYPRLKDLETGKVCDECFASSGKNSKMPIIIPLGMGA